MKALTKISIGFLALAAAALWFTSCSSEDVAQNGGSQGNTYLTLSINTGDVSNTRASDWTASVPGNTDENKINNMTVGIFDKDGNVRTIVDLAENKETGKSVPNSYTLSTVSGTTTATANIVTSSLTATDVVLVAVNAPANKFAGVTTQSDFNKVSETLADAVTSTTEKTKETNTKIPMYGEGKLTGSESNYSATVDVYHMLAKVTLESLKVDFKADGPYKSAKFTPTAFFMINVPENFQFKGTVANKLNEAWTSTTSMYHAWNDSENYATPNTAATSMGNYAQYLTTEALGITSALTGNADATSTNTCSKKACFYVTPSAATEEGGKNMKLVIAGTFENGTKTSTVYYPIPLNASYAADGTVSPAVSGTTTYAVYPNVDYHCKVVIRSIGAATPNVNLSPETASITITVKDFVTAEQNTEFN